MDKTDFYILLYRFKYTVEKHEYAYFQGKKREDNKHNYEICRKFGILKLAGKKLIFLFCDYIITIKKL